MASFQPNPIKGRRPVLQNCRLGELEVDPEYQRSTENKASQALIRAIARDWDWRLCQPLVVSRRMDGGEERYFVVDGQHRLAAARLRGDLYDLPCVVTDYADRSEEAAAFVALNRRRRPLGALDFFKASIAEGEAEATAMLRVIEAAGLRLAPHINYISWKPGMISNIGGIRRSWKEHGPEVTGRALGILARAFEGQIQRYAGTIFPGIAAAIADPPPGADDQLLEMILAEDDQPTWAMKIGERKARLGCSPRRAAEIEISEAYLEAAAEMLEDAA